MNVLVCVMGNIHLLPKTHSKTYLKNIPKIFPKYSKNIHAEIAKH
jgi:hypothetical protein